MKRHSFVCEILIFCVILLIFVLPSAITPFISSDINFSFTYNNFPVLQVVFGIISILLYVFFNEKTVDFWDGKKRFYVIWYRIIFPATYTFCLLFFVSLIFTFAGKIIPENFNFYFVKEIPIEKPENFVQWIFCIINFMFAALFEEMIYRFYLEDAFYGLISKKSSKKFWKYFCMIAASLLFAIGHLYLGILSVLNALAAHYILRRCYKKSGIIYGGIAAHFCYNLLVFILL